MAKEKKSLLTETLMRENILMENLKESEDIVGAMEAYMKAIL